MTGLVLDERYALGRELGSGGEARVFQAVDRFKEEPVAIRVGLIPARLEKSRARDEQGLPAAIPRHSHWITCRDVGHDARLGDYQVLDLLEGKTLAQLVAMAPLEMYAWHDFVDASLTALEALHRAGFIHGDLHSDNFLRQDRGEPHWKLLELPFLRFAAVKSRSALFGSIHTLAPEQIDGAPASVATDFYALGCLYYYAASGRYPQEGATSAEIAIARLREEPPSLLQVIPGFPRQAAHGVMTLLAHRPADRPADIASIRGQLGIA